MQRAAITRPMSAASTSATTSASSSAGWACAREAWVMRLRVESIARLTGIGGLGIQGVFYIRISGRNPGAAGVDFHLRADNGDPGGFDQYKV
jgi:hypothetical protein